MYKSSVTHLGLGLPVPSADLYKRFSDLELSAFTQ